MYYSLFFFSTAALDHRWWLLWPRHECTVGRVWDGAWQASLLRRRWQNDLCHCVCVQEPLAGLRGHKKRTSQEGKEQEYRMKSSRYCWIDGGRFGFSLLKCGGRAGNWGLLDWRKDSSSKADWLSGKSAESAAFAGGKRCVCVHGIKGEWKEEVCVLHCGENLNVPVCILRKGGGDQESPWGFFIPRAKPIWYLSTSSSATAPYITHTLVYTQYQEYPLYFSFTLDLYKIQSLGADCSTHQHVAELARQHRSACCRID